MPKFVQQEGLRLFDGVKALFGDLASLMAADRRVATRGGSGDARAWPTLTGAVHDHGTNVGDTATDRIDHGAAYAAKLRKLP